MADRLDLPAKLKSRLNLATNVSGVVVGQVIPGSPAEESGIRPGDVIVRVANSDVRSPEQVVSAIRTAQQQKKQAVSLLVMRDGVTSYVGLQLES
jgi:serine protease Do